MCCLLGFAVNSKVSDAFVILWFSGDGNVRILKQSCTSGYKYETFKICFLILSNKYFLLSHLKFFHFQGGERNFQDHGQNNLILRLIDKLYY